MGSLRRRVERSTSRNCVVAAPRPFARRARRGCPALAVAEDRRERRGHRPGRVQRPTRSFSMRQASSARAASRPKPRRDGRTSRRRTAATQRRHSRTTLPRRRLPERRERSANFFHRSVAGVGASTRACMHTRDVVRMRTIRAQNIFSKIFCTRSRTIPACTLDRVRCICLPSPQRRQVHSLPSPHLRRTHLPPSPLVGEGCSVVQQRETGEGVSAKQLLRTDPLTHSSRGNPQLRPLPARGEGGICACAVEERDGSCTRALAER